MRPSCDALTDIAVARYMEADTSIKSTTIHAQLKQQVRVHVPYIVRLTILSVVAGGKQPQRTLRLELRTDRDVDDVHSLLQPRL